jgi:hypothetical protein
MNPRLLVASLFVGALLLVGCAPQADPKVMYPLTLPDDAFAQCPVSEGRVHHFVATFTFDVSGRVATVHVAPPPGGSSASPAPAELCRCLEAVLSKTRPAEAVPEGVEKHAFFTLMREGGIQGMGFDRAAAATALGAVDLQPCRVTNAPSGRGHVTVTFGNTGTIVDAEVDEGPFVGNATGACIETQFKKARIPKFLGGKVKVGKTFHVD